MPTQPTRRSFLKTGCLTAAGVGLALVAGGAPAFSYQPPVDLPSPSFGGTAAGKRILVAYASKAGSTAEVAAFIARKLADAGLAVDLRRAKSVRSVDGYRAVVVGSAIRPVTGWATRPGS